MASERMTETELDNAVLTKSATDEEIVTEDNEGIPQKESPETEIPLPKISNESRHSIGSYNVPIKERIVGTSASLGVGGGRSNRPSQSENILAKSQSEIQVCATNSLSVSQTSKQSLMTFSSSGTFYDHNKKKVDVRIPPKPVQSANTKDIVYSMPFYSMPDPQNRIPWRRQKLDTTDFRQMEQGLLQLLDDFHSGKLQAFGQNCTFEKMESVREQQEKLARLHFDLNAQQEMSGQHTDEGIKIAKGNLSKLMENLQVLSHSIEQLQSGCVGTEAEK